MANEHTTVLADTINPQVMGDMISAKIPTKIVVTPFAKVDTELEGAPGNTITVPSYAYIGDAEDLAEGIAAEAVKLTATTAQATVKKAVKVVEITDEAKLSGYGDPEGQAVNQLAKSVASKMDADAMKCITTMQVQEGDGGVQLSYNGVAAVISYNGIVDAVDVFNEEFNSEKVIFVNPKQVTTLRKDPNFIAADKYASNFNVVMTGEVGRIANCRVVPSKKVVENTAKTGWLCPIVKLNSDAETEDELPAITIYMKRGVNFETDRDVKAKKDIFSVDEHYTVALSDASKVVLATFKK